MKIKWKASNGLVGCSIDGEIEMDDDADDEDIEEEVRNEVLSRMEWFWDKVA